MEKSLQLAILRRQVATPAFADKWSEEPNNVINWITALIAGPIDSVITKNQWYSLFLLVLAQIGMSISPTTVGINLLNIALIGKLMAL